MPDDLELSPATATGGGIIAADELNFGTATGRLVQRVKLGYGTDGAYTEVATGAPYPVRIESTRFAVDSAAGGTDTGMVLLAVRDDTPGEITATDGDYAQLRTATDGSLRVTQNGSISVIQSTAADLNMTAATTSVFDVQQMSSATSPVSIGTYTATGIANVVNASSATIPVSISSTVNIAAATGSMEVIQAVATALNVTVSTANTFDTAVATTATQPVSVGTYTATGVVNIANASTATIPVSIAATVSTTAATGSIPVVQAVATALNVTVSTANTFDVSAATTATQPVAVTNWSATDLNVNLAQTATVAITGTVNVATTATQPVQVTNWSATDLNVNLAQTATVAVTGTVNVATTATQPVTVQNTATVAISGAVEVFQATATAFNAIVRPFSLRGQGTQIFSSVSATGLATIATGGGANVFRDLVWMTLSNNATTEAQVRIRDTSTSTGMNMNLAGDGGGMVFTPITPMEQSAANGVWDVQLESAIVGQVYVAAQFLDVT